MKDFKIHRTRENLQDEINDMTPDYHYYIDIRPQSDRPAFFEVFHKDCSREDHQEDIIAHDWDGSIDCRHRSDVEGERAIRSDRSHYLFHYAYEIVLTRSQSNPNQNAPENALR